MYRKTLSLLALSASTLLLTGCFQTAPKQGEAPFVPPPPAPVEVTQKNTAGSLFNNATAMNLYGDKRASRVGDVITVVLEEKTSSSKSNSTTLDKSNYTGVQGGTWAGGNPIKILGKPLDVNISGSNSFSGDASSDMSNSLKGNISVMVHEVRGNGTLYVRGEKWLTLNQGEEYIRISGIIRSDDISPENEISSNKIADARISYSGKGSLHDTGGIGWLSKFFISPLFPI